MELTRTDRWRWQRGMSQEHTCTAMPAGASTPIFFKATSKRASWPDSGRACIEREMQHQFGEMWSEVLKNGSLNIGTACSAFFCSQDGNLKGLCHGDDFCVVARRNQLHIFGNVLRESFVVKENGHVGISAEDAKEFNMLNRTIKIDDENGEMILEADTKFVEFALKTMTLVGERGVDSPRQFMKNSKHRWRAPRDPTPAESTACRSLVMKSAYVAQDRTDIAEAVKCITGHMKEPRSGHMMEPMRLGRFLTKNKTCVLTSSRPTSDVSLPVHVDSDGLETRSAEHFVGRRITTE